MLLGGRAAQAQTTLSPRYLQIFYEGTSWLAGRPLLHYSPSFQGRAAELVAEPDSTKALSPGAFLFYMPTENEVTTGPATSVSMNGTAYLRSQDGKMHSETAADRQQARTRENARLNRELNLVAARATLARNALTAALNTAAADGWEVVQLSQWDSKDGLAYLLHHR